MQVLDVNINKIHTEGQSVRDAQDDDHVVELAMSISKHGLLNPITLRKIDAENYQLLAGFHRLAACVRLGWETIPSHITSEDTGSTKSIALIENIIRKNMTLKEEVQSIEYLHYTDKLSISQMCDITGKSSGWIQKRLMINQLGDLVREELLDGRISIQTAEALSRITDESAQNMALNQCIQQKLTGRQAQILADVYQSAPNLSDAVDAGLDKIEEIRQASMPTRRCEACGTIRPLDQLQFIPVCVNGCPEKKEEE